MVVSKASSYSLFAILLALLSFAGVAVAEDKPDFNRDIRPLLSENCFACHGPDKNVREAGLRLDLEASAFSKLESGNAAIVRGKSAKAR